MEGGIPVTKSKAVWDHSLRDAVTHAKHGERAPREGKKIRMPFRYTKTNILSMSLKTPFTSAWKAAGVFTSPNGKT